MEARAYAAVNGYETGTVPNLGKGAFSKARDHKPRGLVALSGSDVYYAIMGPVSYTHLRAWQRLSRTARSKRSPWGRGITFRGAALAFDEVAVQRPYRRDWRSVDQGSLRTY